ncbi:FAD binding domain-containing protein [Daedaleopsis nitida]|nr:FAD binding domain-containing protein [Daedaleopsis nitida]
MTVRESHVDVLIIGAGPAGVMAANALAGAGVNVRIVDKRPSGVAAGQADGLHPRSLEILQSYGLLEKILKKGHHIWKSTFYNPSSNGGIELTTRTPLVNAPTARYPHIVTLHQGAIENIFVESMKEKGYNVERATVPTSMEFSEVGDLTDPKGFPVKVVLEHTDRGDNSTEIVHAKYVIGSDGAHSWVRKTLGIEMDGDVTDSIWGVLDMVPDMNLPDYRNQAFIHSHAGTVFIIPRENDLVRLYIQQSDTIALIDPATGRADKNRASPEILLAQAKKIMSPYSVEIKDGQVDWWTIYVVGQRVAKSYSVHDRAFIAGDACHTHSPKAGQGMNASMADTHNLAWKVAYVLKGWASPSLLKTYESERRKFAQDLISFDKHWSKLFNGKPRTDENEEGVTHDQFMSAFKTFGGFTSGIGIRYEPSLIVNPAHQPLATGLTVGERMVPHVFIRAADSHPLEMQDLLPADTRFKILVFGGDISIPKDRARLQELAVALEKPGSFVNRYGRGEGGKWTVFDLLTFSSGKEDRIAGHLDFPTFFRPHWSKVLLDDFDVHGRSGGGGYTKYGIDEHQGAIVLVRPDGYVGMVAPLEGVEEVQSYFSSFLL